MILDKMNKNNENEPQKMCPQVVEFIEKMPIVFISDNQKVNIVNNINEVKKNNLGLINNSWIISINEDFI